jgi:hypothetical protein
MDGYEAQIYENCKTQANRLKLTLSIKGDRFVLNHKKGTTLGYFKTIDLLSSFLHGYEWGNG